MLAALFGTQAFAADAAKRGGTLRGMFATDVDFIDPSLAYYTHSWQIMGATGANLLRFADAEGSAGSRLVPEVAAGFPTVSKDGRTYTFTLRTTFRFSNGKRVTAANFAWSINRALSSRQQSPAGPFVADIVGARAVLDGKARSAAGVRVLGPAKLQIRLTQAAPDILTRLAMPFFQAIDTATGINAQGAKAPLAAAGPYYVASWTPNTRLLLRRNPYYKRSLNRYATRPANFDQVQYEANISLDAQVLRIKAGQADFAAEGISPSAHADLARQYGINRRQYQVRQVPITYFVSMNTTRGLFRDANVRKAVNLAIDRQAMLAQRGYLAGKRADQILPPGIPGFRDANIWPLRFTEANLAKARQLMRGRTTKALMLAGNRGASLTIPQIVKFNLAKIGIDMDTRHLASGPLSSTVGRRGEPFELYLGGWHADYPDPNNFVDILLNGNNIREANNNNTAYFNVPAVNRRLEAAAKLTGAARYRTYAQLDVDISKQYAPWASYSYANNRDFVSAGVGCYSYHPTYSFNLVLACRR
ncbi:MAG TPA: ABC transporter substrate-binding protein [Gaiellaceae bacterium]|nr:ABC transporter substrate-binding protein [Gaiellaceae bacterium]